MLQGIDSVQPTGSDECFLDVFGGPKQLKNGIRDFRKSEVTGGYVWIFQGYVTFRFVEIRTYAPGSYVRVYASP